MYIDIISLRRAELDRIKETKTDHCSCKEACPHHGKCWECVVIHRGNRDHLPFCMQDMLSERLYNLQLLSEGTLCNYVPHGKPEEYCKPRGALMKREVKLHSVVSPVSVVVVSAYDETGKPDACVLTFYMNSSHVPPCVTIAINNTGNRKTMKSILHSKAFSVGFPSACDMDKVDYIGVETGYHRDKLKDVGFSVTRGAEVNAPVINELKLNLECEVIHTAVVGGHTQISGQIKRIWADDTILDAHGKIMVFQLDPVIYDEEGMAYHHLGEKNRRSAIPHRHRDEKAFRGGKKSVRCIHAPSYTFFFLHVLGDTPVFSRKHFPKWLVCEKPTRTAISPIGRFVFRSNSAALDKRYSIRY